MIGNCPRMNSIGYSDADLAELEKPSNDPQNNMLMGHDVTHLDIYNKTVELNDGTTIKFDKCFIGTGTYTCIASPPLAFLIGFAGFAVLFCWAFLFQKGVSPSLYASVFLSLPG